MDHGHGNGASKKHVRFEVTKDEVKHFTDEQTQGPVFSSSPCSSSDSLEELIVIEDEFILKSPSQSKQPGFESLEQTSSSSKFPPDHKVEQIASYDSCRIPSSVFSSKPATPTDWSVASNESLFSLHMGNTSFSRDQALLLYKSGELPKLDNSTNLQTGLHPVTEVEEAKCEIGLGKKLAAEDNHNPASNAMSPRSECSLHSTQSFAFPVFSNDLRRNGTAKLDQDNEKTLEKPRQQLHEELQQQSPRKPPNASSGKKWLSRFSCFSLPCK